MSIELIEAAWTDPILLSELLEIEKAEIPEHPAGIVTSPGADPSDGSGPLKVYDACTSPGSEIIYYVALSYLSHDPMCCA